MSTHTPGPWRVGDAGHSVFGPPNGNPSPESIALVKDKNNTHLIAAAPGLLQAAKNALDWFNRYMGNDTTARYRCEGIATELDAAIAAADPDFVC